MSFWKSVLGICGTPVQETGWSVADGNLLVDLEKIPALREPGAAVRIEGQSLPDRLLILHGRDGEYHAYVNRCTHMGRRLDPGGPGAALRCCSVSHSEFAYDGQPAKGPARKPVTVLSVQPEENRLRVTLPE
jgi:nitrite reductase/ring-hydroxylating ferredoxin subunit